MKKVDRENLDYFPSECYEAIETLNRDEEFQSILARSHEFSLHEFSLHNNLS